MNYSELIPGCTHFSWHDALFLSSWNIYHIPSTIEKENIIKMASKMEEIRSLLNTPIIVHVWIRPVLNNPTSEHHGQDYNKFVSGAPVSAHRDGRAVDWHPVGMTCDEARAKLLPNLSSLGIRVENKPGSNWVHSDIAEPHPNRYFKP